jgi:hypothetical protein
MIRDDGYYNITLDENHRFTLSYTFDGVFFSAHRTNYVRNERGFWDYDQSAGGSRKLFESRDGAEARRRWEELISSEPRAVHSSEFRQPSPGAF